MQQQQQPGSCGKRGARGPPSLRTASRTGTRHLRLPPPPSSAKSSPEQVLPVNVFRLAVSWSSSRMQSEPAQACPARPCKQGFCSPPPGGTAGGGGAVGGGSLQGDPPGEGSQVERRVPLQAPHLGSSAPSGYATSTEPREASTSREPCKWRSRWRPPGGPTSSPPPPQAAASLPSCMAGLSSVEGLMAVGRDPQFENLCAPFVLPA